MKAGLIVLLSLWGIYTAEVGVREQSGKNDGERVEAYLAYVGLKKGNPYFPDKKRIAHVGFVDSWDDKYVITVEGNANEAGSREGDGVYRKRRLIGSIYQVARWEEAL